MICLYVLLHGHEGIVYKFLVQGPHMQVAFTLKKEIQSQVALTNTNSLHTTCYFCHAQPRICGVGIS